MIAWAFSFVFPMLLVLVLAQAAAARLGANLRSGRTALALAVFSLACVAAPVFPPVGLPLARVLAGSGLSASIPLLALVFSSVWEGFSGTRLLDDRATRASRVFGLACGLLLYPMAMGLGVADPYSLGWEFSPLWPAMWAVAAALIWKGNTFGLVLAACPLAREAGLLESPNLWDYLVDPFYVLASAVGLGSAALRRSREATPAHP